MEARFAHTNIVAANWRKLAQFYVDVFGCQFRPPERDLQGEWLDDLTSIENARIKGIHLLLPGFFERGPTLEIFEYNKKEKNTGKMINKEGLAHIAFAVDDVDACLKLLIEKGGSKIGEVVKTEIEGVGEINVVYAKDPEGNIVEILKWS